jgi:hypothetical protein
MDKISVNDGKYTVVIAEGKLSALRYGEPWRDLTGDNLVYWLAVELQSARETIGELIWKDLEIQPESETQNSGIGADNF